MKTPFLASARQNASEAVRLSSMCRVVCVLAPNVHAELCQWYVQQQLREYKVLFDDTQDQAWLDQVDKR